MTNLATRARLGICGLALVAASSCRDDSTRPEAEPTNANSYIKLDENTFVIKGGSYSTYASKVFGANLAKFRTEVSGDFVLIPADTNYPLHYDVLATRRTVQAKDGKESLIDLALPRR